MSSTSSITTVIKRWLVKGEAFAQRSLTSAGLHQPEARIAGDSQAYWNTSGTDRWKANSHWADAQAFSGGDLWSRIGREHLAIAERGTRMLGLGTRWNRVLEWGCGGGANAVHFAPRTAEFIGVDVNAESLRECERQVKAACDTLFTPVLVNVAQPEQALHEVTEPCDLFLCCYVFELIPSPEYGERLLRIARDILAPGGLALIQIKYDDGRWSTKPRRRGYRTGLAEMTTYPIAAFWELAVTCGLHPEAIQLVPRNELDERYAYYLLTKPELTGTHATSAE